jgi:hypothetical protein
MLFPRFPHHRGTRSLARVFAIGDAQKDAHGGAVARRGPDARGAASLPRHAIDLA